MQNSNNRRYCDRFNMTPQQFQDYKDSKVTRLFWYIGGMAVSTIFYDRMILYGVLTLWLVASYYHNAKCEEQWIKDGSIRR